MTPQERCALLIALGHMEQGDDLTAGVKDFQRHLGLLPDGIVGPKTQGALDRCAPALANTPLGFTRCAPWRNTAYIVSEQRRHPGLANVPVPDKDGTTISLVPASFFSDLSLQGTGMLLDGRFVNVAGRTVPVNPNLYQPVLDRYLAYKARQEAGNKPVKPPNYFGLVVGDNGRVKAVSAFYVIPPTQLGKGYGIQKRKGPDGQVFEIALDPFRTLAADLGKYKTSEPRYKGKGGLVPVGTKVWIAEYVGDVLPDKTTHDGWFVVADTGGGIFGAHFDVFAGTRALMDAVPTPTRAHVWFAGIEERVPVGYQHGLYDK